VLTKRIDAAPRTFPTAMVAATAAVLVTAYAIQVVAYFADPHTALSDLPRVFVHRGIGPTAPPYLDRVLEYPVGAGILLYLASVIDPTPLGVLTVTALAAGALCVATTVVLERRCGARAWRWALATPLLLFAFQNWDVFAVVAMLGALLAFERRRDGLAGGLFGLGAAVKLFPAVVVPPLVALRWMQGDRRGAIRLAATAVAVFAALNLPFALLNRRGWSWTFTFQGDREATWGSLWFWLYRLVGAPVSGAGGVELANVVSMVCLLAGIGWLTVRVTRHPVEPVAIGAAAVALFLLSNKVYSPTYDVWLVVFFVLLPISTRYWIAFCTVDLLIAVTAYGYFHGLDSVVFVHDVLPWLVIARTIVLLALIAVALSPRGRAPDGQKPSGSGSGGGLASSPGIGCSHQSVSSTRRATRQPASVRTNRS
jgi:Glycosyltransferase family 87